MPLSWLFLIVTTYWYIQGHREDRWITQFGFGCVAISYAVRYWNKNSHLFTDTVKCLLIMFWCAIKISFASGMTFDRIVFYSFFLLGIVWLVSEIIDLFKGRTKGHRLVLLIGGILLALQTYMRFKHMPMASLIMLLSWLVLSAGFIAELVLEFRGRQDGAKDT
ncbi:MAG: hypothetical protein Crog4KO_19770 [Crocinitomicaceae bacterium]